MSTPTSLHLPEGTRRITVETACGTFAALEALPMAGADEPGTALLVPGYTGSKEDFIPVLGPLAAAGRRVLAVDMRGQYQTPGPDDPDAYHPGQLGSDIAALAEATETAHLLGHSFGGLVVREAVLHAAFTPSSLTLMSSGPAALPGPRAEELRSMLNFLNGVAPQDLKGKIAELWHGVLKPQAVADGVPGPIVAFLEERMLASNPVGLATMAGHMLEAGDSTEDLASRGIPTLVLYGEDDNAWPAAMQEDMAARLGAQRTCIPGAAHSPNVEAPATTVQALTTFWNATEARGAVVLRQLRETVPRPARDSRGLALLAVPQVVAPAAGRARPRREHLVVLLGRQRRAHALVRLGTLGGDLFGPAQVPEQRLRRVLPAEHLSGRQVVQFHAPALTAQHSRGGERVQRERERAARVVHAQHMAAGLVVDHDQLGALSVVWRSQVQPVDPPGDRDHVGPRCHGALHPDRLVGRIQPDDVRLHHLARPVPVPRRLCVAHVPLGDPALLEQRAGRVHGAPGERQPPPGGQRVVHAGAEAVVRPGRPFRRHWPVEVAHPVPPRAVEPGSQPGRRA
jgi:pimeloyl-ACP methyl ester carboxylesterase